MSLIDIRKRCLIVETTFHEYGPPPAVPLKLAASCAVIRNPYAGRYEPDLMPFMAELRGLGTLLATELVDTLGKDSIEVYSKAAIVGLDGEMEHGAVWHEAGGWAMRSVLGEPKAMVPAVKAVAVAGYRMMVPVHYIHASYVRSHFNSIEIGIQDAPRPGEILFALVMGTGGRVHARLGGLTRRRCRRTTGNAERASPGEGCRRGGSRRRHWPWSAPAAAPVSAGSGIDTGGFGTGRVFISARSGAEGRAAPVWRAGSGRGGHLQHFVVDRRGLAIAQLLQMIGQLGDGQRHQAVLGGVALQRGAAHHGAVGVHQLAQHAGRTQAASTARSTEPSVWPRRVSTPPGWARSGNTWPGLTMSPGWPVGETAARMVVTRSAADTPVLTPSRASIDTVKAVAWRLSFFCTMGGRPRRSSASPGRHRQTMPLPSRISCAMTGTVSLSAATIRSASFSRSKSSIRMTGRPRRR